jgi:hypothetical protein
VCGEIQQVLRWERSCPWPRRRRLSSPTSAPCQRPSHPPPPTTPRSTPSTSSERLRTMTNHLRPGRRPGRGRWAPPWSRACRVKLPRRSGVTGHAGGFRVVGQDAVEAGTTHMDWLRQHWMALGVSADQAGVNTIGTRMPSISVQRSAREARFENHAPFAEESSGHDRPVTLWLRAFAERRHRRGPRRSRAVPVL